NKFMPAATKNAMTMPVEPPMTPPMATNRPVRTANKSAVFAQFMIDPSAHLSFGDHVSPASPSIKEQAPASDRAPVLAVPARSPARRAPSQALLASAQASAAVRSDAPPS